MCDFQHALCHGLTDRNSMDLPTPSPKHIIPNHAFTFCLWQKSSGWKKSKRDLEFHGKYAAMQVVQLSPSVFYLNLYNSNALKNANSLNKYCYLRLMRFKYSGISDNYLRIT